mmetsp:Transcript_13236/g.29248  ORF Transcript_13236/g.29248 Transcript_13236/m.29248 type:complete len:466 (+) Transcript_13236:30-1427(+)
MRKPNALLVAISSVSLCSGGCHAFVSPLSVTSSRTSSRSADRFTPANRAAAAASATAAAVTIATAQSSSVLSNLQTALHADPSYVLSSILVLSMVGIVTERRTQIGKALSANIVTMALALLLANLGMVPFTSPVYNLVNKSLVPLAVPLFLFDSNIRRIITDTGSLLFAFGIGAFSTIIGTLVAFPLIQMRSLGIDQGWRVACALAARHIGGAINFVAVADTLNVHSSAVSAAIAADNVVVAIYFSLLFYLAKTGEEDDTPASAITKDEAIAVIDPESVEDTSSNGNSDITLYSIGTSLCLSSCLVTVGGILTKRLLPSTSSLPLISLLTVASATIFPTFFSGLVSSGAALGVLVMQMFFAVSGAAGSMKQVFQQAPSLFLFSALQIGVHFVCLLLLGKVVFRLDGRDLFLASNANVGGPTTAAAMAKGKQWPRRVLPALLIGVLGYATATAVALALGPILVRLL